MGNLVQPRSTLVSIRLREKSGTMVTDYSVPRSSRSLSFQVLKQETIRLSQQDESNYSAEMAVIKHSSRESTEKADLHTVLNTLQVPQEPGGGAPQDDRDHQELRHHPHQWEPSHRHITPKVETQGRCTYSPFR